MRRLEQKRPDKDFREVFARMAAQAVINRDELAMLLATTAGAITQMSSRGELPKTAFPGKRRACWFVGDVRQWLDGIAAARSFNHASAGSSTISAAERPRTGRPRLAHD